MDYYTFWLLLSESPNYLQRWTWHGRRMPSEAEAEAYVVTLRELGLHACCRVTTRPQQALLDHCREMGTLHED